MWWILLFVLLVVLILRGLSQLRSLKEQVVAAQENARIAAEHAQQLYTEYLRNPYKD